MDATDKQLLRLLSENSHISASRVSRQVNLSVAAINKRIAKLYSDRVIRRFTMETDPKKVNKEVCAFVLVEVNSYPDTDELIRVINGDPDFLECYAVTGEYDYIVKVYAETIEQLEEKLISLKNCQCVNKTNTVLTLFEHKFSSAVLPNE